MDAQEKRDISYVIIPGAFLQTKSSDGMIIKLQGAVVESLIRINPTWQKCVVYLGNKRTPTIYSEVIKALYDTVDSSKLFYGNLCSLILS